MVGSSPVASVDANVAFGQVAGPETRLPLIASANHEFDCAFRLIQMFLEFGFIEIDGESSRTNNSSLQGDVDAARVELDA